MTAPKAARARPPMSNVALALLVLTLTWGSAPLMAQEESPSSDACSPEAMPGAVWWGNTRTMTAQRLVSYAAPVIWFSWEEPSLGGAAGAEIRHPESFTFDAPADGPVLYYQITTIQVRESVEEAGAFQRDPGEIGDSRIDLRAIVGLDVLFYAYYQREQGVGAHPHDVEPAAFRMIVMRGTDVPQYVGDCPDDLHFLVITRSTGKAHGLVWFWNVLDTDEATRFPMHLMVEEGKHAFGTDKNGDGLFTPAYDVNVRVNDAWGVRDNIRSGTLFTGAYQSWMTKARQPEHRVLPPLPDDSPLIDDLEERVDGMELATYELRPFPAVEQAGDDLALRRLMENQAEPGWPELGRVRDAEELGRFMDEGAVLKSLSVSAYADGDLGVSFVFPLLVIAHVNDPMTGGYLVHRMYFKGTDLADFGWMITYMPSASRWMDGYLGAGYEAEDVLEVDGTVSRDRDFVLEAGLKFRANIAYSPVRFLPFTDFWGIRMGLKNRGFWDIERLTYVFEIGAGSF